MHSWNLAVIAALVLSFAVVSRRLGNSRLTPSIVFVGAGILLGSEVLGWIDLAPEGGPIRLLAEATLTLVLFSDASRLDLAALRREYAVPVRLLGIGLPLAIAAGAAAAAGVIDELTLVEAVILSLVLAPTDAALSEAAVSDRRVPTRIRQGLNVESGLADGICLPLLLIAIVVAEAEIGATTTSGAVRLVLEEIGYGLLGGLIAGMVAAALLRFAEPRKWIDAMWRQILPVAAAGLAYGIAVPLGGSGFVAAFVAGLVFGTLRRGTGADVEHFVEEAGGLLNGVTFVVFGAAILGPALAQLTWQSVVYAILSLTVVRMIPVGLALLGTGARAATVAYVGWFGPRGLPSIVFGVILVEDANLPQAEPILLAVVVTIGLSVLLHGLTAIPLTERYVRWYERHPSHKQPLMESVPATEQRWRGDLGSR